GDLNFVRLFDVEGEMFADRRFIREELFSEGLIDDDGLWRELVIVSRKTASGQQRNLHRLQKVFARVQNVAVARRPDAAISVRRGAERAAQIDGAIGVVVRKQRRAGKCHFRRARQRFQLLAYTLIKLREPFPFVAGQARRDLEHQQVCCIEARTSALQIPQRAHEQARADQQQQRQRNLRHYQPTTQQRTRGAARTAPAVFERRRQIHFGRPQRRSQAEDDSG